MGLEAEARADPLAQLDDRRGRRRATHITSQLPVAHWHDLIGDPTLANAILDRPVHNAAYRITSKASRCANVTPGCWRRAHPPNNNDPPASLRSDCPVRMAVEWVAECRWNRRLDVGGTGGRMAWNGHPHSPLRDKQTFLWTSIPRSGSQASGSERRESPPQHENNMLKLSRLRSQELNLYLIDKKYEHQYQR
jgi:hypothetical protein